MRTTSYQVIGLTCEHCAAAVRDELSALPGVSGVDVALEPASESTVRVTSAEPLSDEQVSAALDEAGNYRLVR